MRYYLFNTNKCINIILDYLDYRGYSLRPINIEYDDEIDYPIIITETNDIYNGENACIHFYTNESCIIHLKDKSDDFKRNKKIKID